MHWKILLVTIKALNTMWKEEIKWMSQKLKRYIVIGLIVLINIILIIFVCISVMKSINRIESGSNNNVNNSIGEESVASSTEDTNYIENDEV